MNTWWLLEVKLAGEVHRYAHADLEVPTADGRGLPFLGRITDDISVELTARPFASATVQVETQVAFVPTVDCATLRARGVRFGRAWASLSRWTEGSTYEERRVVVVGRLRSPKYGGADAEFAATIADSLWEDTNLTGTATERVDGETWEHADSLLANHLGLQYPIVFGRPGRVSTSTSADGWIPSTKALWVDHRRSSAGVGNYDGLILVVAGHHVRSTRVWAVADGDFEVQRLPVFNGFDALGQAIAYVPWFATRDGDAPDELSDPFEIVGTAYGYGYGTENGSDTYGLGASAVPSAMADSTQKVVHLGWYDDVNGDIAAGGLERNGELVRGAGAVLEVLLGYSGVTVDPQRSAGALRQLDVFAIDAAIEVRTQPWEWITTYLLPVLPACIVTGPAGAHIRAWVPSAPPVAHLNLDDPELESPDELTDDDEDLVNQIAVKYNRLSTSGAAFVSTVTVGARRDRPATAGIESWANHPGCDAARQAGDAVAIREIEAPVVCDASTAWRIADGVAGEYSTPGTVLVVRVPEARFPQVDLWSPVTVSSDEYSLDAARARVDGLTVDGSGLLTLTLRLL